MSANPAADTVDTTVRNLPRELHKRARQRAMDEDRTFSALVAEALDAHMRRGEAPNKKIEDSVEPRPDSPDVAVYEGAGGVIVPPGLANDVALKVKEYLDTPWPTEEERLEAAEERRRKEALEEAEDQRRLDDWDAVTPGARQAAWAEIPEGIRQDLVAEAELTIARSDGEGLGASYGEEAESLVLYMVATLAKADKAER